MDDKKVYSNIDLLKFFFSFFIIMIHTSLFADVNTTVDYIFVNIITRIAVPFFFLSSGFFFAKSFEYNKQKKVAGTKTNFKRLRKIEWRIILLYAVWSFIYLFIALPVNYGGWSIKNIVDYFITSVVRCSYYHLWYVYALVFCLSDTLFSYEASESEDSRWNLYISLCCRSFCQQLCISSALA